MGFDKIYPNYVTKVENKGKTVNDLFVVLNWLTGYSLDELISTTQSMRDFFDNAPKLHPNRELIKGVVCGVRVEDIDDPLMKNIRYMDKLVDELARGKKIEKILRK